jgi:hypothetical protein
VEAPVKPIWTANAINGRPAVLFTNNAYLHNFLTNLLVAGSARTVFAVGQATAGGDGGVLIAIRRDGVDCVIQFNVYLGALQVYTDSSSVTETIDPNAFSSLISPFYATFASPGAGSLVQVYINGTNQVVSGGATTTEIGALTGFFIGRRNINSYWDGYMAEMLVYDSQLSAANRASVEYYLGRKYGLIPAPTGTVISLR